MRMLEKDADLKMLWDGIHNRLDFSGRCIAPDTSVGPSPLRGDELARILEKYADLKRGYTESIIGPGFFRSMYSAKHSVGPLSLRERAGGEGWLSEPRILHRQTRLIPRLQQRQFMVTTRHFHVRKYRAACNLPL